MKSAKEMFEFMGTPEFSSAVQRAVDADRRAESSFRQGLVDEFNRALASEGLRADPDTLERQERFIALAMPTNEAHAMAARYAGKVGRELPPPPPSLMLDDV